jgi:hypothetical protein
MVVLDPSPTHTHNIHFYPHPHKLETSFDEDLFDNIMDGLRTCSNVERMMAFLTAIINVLTIDHLVQMVANLNHERFIDTFPDGRLEQQVANLTAAIQMYERGGNPSARVNQLERENIRLRDMNQMLNDKYRISEHTYMVVPGPEQELPALGNNSRKCKGLFPSGSIHNV